MCGKQLAHNELSVISWFPPIFACSVSHGSFLLFNILCSIYMFSLSLLNCKANYLRKGTFVFSISQLSAYGKCEQPESLYLS